MRRCVLRDASSDDDVDEGLIGPLDLKSIGERERRELKVLGRYANLIGSSWTILRKSNEKIGDKVRRVLLIFDPVTDVVLSMLTCFGVRH